MAADRQNIRASLLAQLEKGTINPKFIERLGSYEYVTLSEDFAGASSTGPGIDIEVHKEIYRRSAGSSGPFGLIKTTRTTHRA